jgi:ABC-2 type transport system permease protein
MNWNVVSAVARRDLKSWFGNPTGYLFIVLFVVLAAAALLQREFFSNNLANLDTLNEWFPRLAILFCAAITMGTWSNERASGTVELLLTMPAKDSDLLVGKYLASLGVYTLSLAFMLTLPIGLSFLGWPDWGQLIANYLGYWLLGVMLIAVTMLGSQASENMTISLIVGAIVAGLVYWVGFGVNLLGLGTAWQLNGPEGQFAEFGRGMVPFSGLLLFIGLAAAFLYLNLALLARRHYRQGSHEGLHRSLRFVATGVAVCALTVIGVNALPRVDATVEGIHSLGDESVALLEQLPDDRTVFVTAYVSEDVPAELVPQHRTLLNLLDQFDHLSGGKVQQRVVFTEPYSDEANEAEDNFGIQPRMQYVEEGGVYTQVTKYLGFVVQCGTEEVVVPFVEAGLALEYELLRSIRVAAKADRRKIGVLNTDVEIYGGFDPQTFQPKQRWEVVNELELQYEIVKVDPANGYPEDIDALIVPQPSSLIQDQMDRLQSWLLAGNKALLLEDPAPFSAPGTAATDQKPSPGGMFGGGQGPQKGNFQGLLASLGVRMSTDQVVWDLSSRKFRGGAGAELEVLFLGGDSFAQDSAVTSGLQNAVTLFAGYFQQAAKDGFSFEPLMWSRKPLPGSRDMNGVISKFGDDGLFRFSFPGQPLQPNMRRRHRAAPQDYALAARIMGPATGIVATEAEPAVGKECEVILIADLDMISNMFYSIRSRSTDADMRFDNITFVLNCIDSLVGDESLVELRKRRPQLRTLVAVENAQETFEEQWMVERDNAEEAAAQALDAAQTRLDEAVAGVRDNPDLDEQAKAIQIQTIETNENRKLAVQKEQIESDKQRRIDQARHARDANKRNLYNSYRIVMLLLAPLPALVMGLVTFNRRRSRENSIVPKNRQVS